MQDLHKQLSVAQNFSKQLNASGMSEESAIGGMFAGYGGLGISSFTTGAMLGGGLTMGGLCRHGSVWRACGRACTRYSGSYER
ncbi:hypothetical protein oki184_06840 [Helicobacter pylori]